MIFALTGSFRCRLSPDRTCSGMSLFLCRIVKFNLRHDYGQAWVPHLETLKTGTRIEPIPAEFRTAAGA